MNGISLIDKIAIVGILLAFLIALAIYLIPPIDKRATRRVDEMTGAGLCHPLPSERLGDEHPEVPRWLL